MTRLFDAPTRTLEPLEWDYNRSHAVTGRICHHKDPDTGEMCGKATKGYAAYGKEIRKETDYRCYQHRVKRDKGWMT